MYSPSMFFGGSSLLHLMASHPRVVALFGVAALVGTLLQSPLGTPDVIGNVGYFKQLDQVARQQNAIDPEIVIQARKAAHVLAQLPNSRLNEIVVSTLRECGAACVGVQTSAVLKDRELLADVLLLHALNQANVKIAAVRSKAAASAIAEMPQ